MYSGTPTEGTAVLWWSRGYKDNEALDHVRVPNLHLLAVVTIVDNYTPRQIEDMDLYKSITRMLPANYRPWSSPSFQTMSLGPHDRSQNPLMIQFFTWDSKHEEVSWWKHFEQEIPLLAERGFTQVWLPPPNKAMVKDGRGYDAYDLWDLGEFDQRGTIGTRWGIKEELLQACATAKAHGIDVLIDAVLGHKLGGDRTETFSAVPVEPENRLVKKGQSRKIQGWTAYDFPGRKDKYSALKWSHRHFTGVDWDQKTRTSEIFYIEDPSRKGWSKYVDKELGNYDYLLGCDIDHRQPDVRADLFNWGSWVLETTGAAGFRLDAIKHMDRRFLLEFLERTRKNTSRANLFAVAEYWSADLSRIEPYIRAFEGQVSFFDAPLHYHFHSASKQGNNYDLRDIFAKTIVDRRPGDAVTFVDNHDTQIGQSLESWVDARFKIQAYALILLRGHGYPCVFYGDLYPNHECYNADIADKLVLLIRARKQFAFGTTTDYFRYRNCIGFVRSGDGEREGCVVVVRSSIETIPADDDNYADEIRMPVKQKRHTENTIYRDLLGYPREVTVTPDGWGTFPCAPGGVTVWTTSAA